MPKTVIVNLWAAFWLLGYSGLSAAATEFPATGGLQGPVYVYQSDDDFDTVKDNLEMAITNQGLNISGTLHVNEMLERTGQDLGYPDSVYLKAESVEFCSAVMSHKMTQLDPLNLVVCPFTIAVFVKTAQPDSVYVAFRQQRLAGPAETADAVLEEVEGLLHRIVREALGL